MQRCSDILWSIALLLLSTSVIPLKAFQLRSLWSSRSAQGHSPYTDRQRFFAATLRVRSDRKAHRRTSFPSLGLSIGLNGQDNARKCRLRSLSAKTKLAMLPTDFMSSDLLSFADQISKDNAEAIAGPFFGASLFPYLAFIYFLNVKENNTPKGVTIGFATCLLFVFLTIPGAILAKQLYGVSLADCDWLHGSAESLLTVTNLVTVLAFRQVLNARESGDDKLPSSALSYAPMTLLVIGLTILAVVTAIVPYFADATVHSPYLGGFLDLPKDAVTWGHPEPENALTVACWIIHWSSLVEFLVAMGFAWRWADVVGNERWKGITWGLLPLHSSGIAACTYHVFYNSIHLMLPFQAILTCIGNSTAAFAAYRLAISNGWQLPRTGYLSFADTVDTFKGNETNSSGKERRTPTEKSSPLVGFEDLGDALAGDTDYTFLIKLFVGCAVASYAVKYGELLVDFPFSENTSLGILLILVPTALNAFKWHKRSQNSSFEGWF